MVEVLIAVAVLAAVCTAALRLAFLAQNTLIKIEEREALIVGAREIIAEIYLGLTEDRGRRDGFEWRTEEKEAEFFDEDFGRLELEGLSFDNQAEPSASETIKLNWREVTVRDEKGNSITIYLPQKESGSSAATF